MARQLNALHGNLTVENAIRNVTSIVQTGSLITTYYEFEFDTIYLANARGVNETGPDDAYDRYLHIQISLTLFFFLIKMFKFKFLI